MSATVEEEKLVQLQLPRKLGFLLECHPYKVAWGGRSSLKSWSFSRSLLTLGVHQDIRILCCREVQKSLVESVHQLLIDQIKALDLGDYYGVTENAIRGKRRDTLFRFTGLAEHTVESIKGFEGFDIFWFNEAQAVKRRSWQIALPTLFRTPGSECWVDFNPNLDADEVWERFIIHPPPDAVVREMNWRDAVACGWWSPEQERLRQYDLQHSPLEYDNIWEGKPQIALAGAIFAPEIVEMVKDGRYRPIPYDPKLPVHRIWDLGWNDLMVCVMVQKPHPSALNVVNYIEESHITYAGMLAAMDPLGYRWGTDYLPHDGDTHDPKSGTSARKLLRGLGCRVRIIPKSDAEARIKAARMMFPRVYMDTRKLDTPPERPDRLLGAGHLMERLKRYKRNVPKTTGEPAGPTHDAASHGCFDGETNVLTRYGMCQMKNLPQTGEVLTLCGWSTYQNPRITRTHARLVEVEFDDGLTVKCTPDHLFLTDNGWKSAQSLQRDTVIRSALTRSLGTSMAPSTKCGPANGIWQRVVSACIETFGGLRSALFQPVATSTTGMGTPSTTLFRTSNAFPRPFIFPRNGLLRSAPRSSRACILPTAPAQRPPSGIGQRKDVCGIAGWPVAPRAGRTASARSCPASSAASRLAELFEKVLARPSSALRPAKPLLIASVRPLSATVDVWDITVPGTGHFSLQNGAVVHNSDAFGGLAEIVDQLRNDGDLPPPRVRKYSNVDPSVGMLG